MKPELLRFGTSHSPVVVIDDFSGSLDPILKVADGLAPYPLPGNYYPGLRRIITASDSAANAYVERTCELAAQYIAGAFDVQVVDRVPAAAHDLAVDVIVTPTRVLAASRGAP